MTIGEYIRIHQPIIYIKLMAMCQKEMSLGEIAKLMGHSAFKRIGRRVRQVRHG